VTAGSLQARELRCERLLDAFGVHSSRPVFSWIPTSDRRGESQTAYRIRVATDPALLAADVPDLWDSGRVASDAVTGATYDGRALESRMACWWSVQLWDRDGRASQESPVATFELGLLLPEDWSARWIADRATGTSPLLRREFDVPGEIRSARAYVTGLGYYELRLNGAKVGDRLLEPAQTNYDQIPELTDSRRQPAALRSPRVAYTVYDIADHVRSGPNAVGLILTGGWYSPGPDHGMTRSWGDRPRGLVQLEIETADGERLVVASDDTWAVSAGPITYASPVHGERHDARLEEGGWDNPGFAGSWLAAGEVPAPASIVASAAIEPIRVIETIAPITVTRRSDDVEIVDFGQHLSGWTRVRVSGPAGGTVTLRHGGDLDDAGGLDDSANLYEDLAPAYQTDVFTLRGAGTEEWEPRFTIHGFRYVEVTTSPGVRVESAEARVVHSDVAMTGEFSSSHDLLNRIDRNVRWTYRASLQGYPSDAADRAERVGWLGDPGWVIDDYLYQFDSLAFWAKWLEDIRDSQLASGELPTISPVHWTGSFGPLWPDWGATYPVIAWHLFQFSGDRAILERHYAGMRDALGWFAGLAVDGIVEAGLGDHMEPQPDGTCNLSPHRTPVALSSTAWLYRVAEIVAETAAILGDAPTATAAQTLADSVRDAFTARFFDPGTARYASGSQTALALPLWFGMVPADERERVGAALVAQIVERDDTHLWTGTMGTAAVQQVLGEIGAAGLMFDLATRTGFPGWADQIEQGATTVWEAWGKRWTLPRVDDTILLTASRNMKLLAAVSVFLYRDVAGIRPAAPGWARMIAKPAVTDRLSSARARVATARGTASIAWDRRPARLSIEVEVPSTSRADIWLPIAGLTDPVVQDGDTVIWADGRAVVHPEIHHPRLDDGYLRFETGGGTYRLTATGRGVPSPMP
jgi:alpha-L-rhamnosidase